MIQYILTRSDFNMEGLTFEEAADLWSCTGTVDSKNFEEVAQQVAFTYLRDNPTPAGVNTFINSAVWLRWHPDSEDYQNHERYQTPRRFQTHWSRTQPQPNALPSIHDDFEDEYGGGKYRYLVQDAEPTDWENALAYYDVNFGLQPYEPDPEDVLLWAGVIQRGVEPYTVWIRPPYGKVVRCVIEPSDPGESETEGPL